jgi:hypothetical protein
VTLYRRGDSSKARDALARALAALPDDPGRWLDLGRLFGRVGWAGELATVRAHARSLCEQRLARTPDDEAAAAALVELLPEADGSRGWTILQPDVMTSAAGATLTRLPDGSVLAGGPNPPVDSYTIKATSGRSGITGLRLEVLPDSSLPNHGPGRYPDGNLHLGEVRLSTVGPSAPVPIHLARARSDHEESRQRRVTGALDGDATTTWSIWPDFGRPHWAVFQADQPIGINPGTRLRIELVSGLAGWPHATLGRFRLSVTDRPFPLFEASLLRIKAREERGLTRLGAAYVLIGDWASAAVVLSRAAARPEASALDGFLLALARHHLGRIDEARSDCDRDLARPGSDLTDEPTRDVAIEALMTIRGLSIDEADSVLLDTAFPIDPFAQ